MNEWTDLGARLLAEARAARQRRLLVLEGSIWWTRDVAAALTEGLPALWLGDAPQGALRERPDRARRLLGNAVPAMVLDLHGGVDSDTLAASVGAVLEGGLTVLRCPPLGGWTRDGLEHRLAAPPRGPEAVGTRFLLRFVSALGRASATFVRQDGGVEDRSPLPIAAAAFDGADQARGVAAVIEHAGAAGELADRPEGPPAEWPDGESQAGGADPVEAGSATAADRPVLLWGDRVRGKSAALGMAAARIDWPVLLTGPGPSTVAAVKGFAPDLTYVAPEELLLRPRPGFLMIDEAAALGLPTLARLLALHPQAVMTATVHGYEGTGAGFLYALRDQLPLREVHLEQAVRWSPGDPVEAFAFDALLLDADPSEGVEGATVEAAQPQRLDRDALDDALLRPLVGLLIMAHYRTRPSDLRRMLDGPNVQIWASLWRGRVVAAALVAEEGGLPAADAAAIHEGRARPRGHLIPEKLIAHRGEEASAGLRGLRIVRLATHPAVQGRGLGAQLAAAIAAQRGFSWIGAVFGATEPRLRRGRRAGLLPVWVSVRRGRSSGLRSVLVMAGRDPAGRAMVARLRRSFVRELESGCSDAFADEDPDLLFALLASGPATRSRLGPEELEAAVACAWGPRRSEAVRGPLVRLVAEALRDGRGEELSGRERQLVVMRVLQARPWSEVLAGSTFGSEHPTRRALKEALRVLLVAEAGAAELAKRFPEAEEIAMAKRHPVPVNESRIGKIREVVAGRWSDVELVLEDVWNPHNAAAVLRSADAFGVGRVHLLYNAEVFPELPPHASGGVKRWMDLRPVDSAERLVEDLRRRGRTIVATALREDAVPLWELDCTGPTAIVFGNEHSGVSPVLLEAADRCIVVPMVGMTQSLNISVSAGIVLGEVARQRRGRPNPWDADKQELLQRWIDREVDVDAPGS